MSRHCLLTAAAALSLSLTAHADTFSVFNVIGAFQSGGSISGTITLDTTTNLFTDNSIKTVATGQTTPFMYRLINNYPAVPGVYDVSIDFTPGAGLSELLSLYLPVDTLAGYTGSALCSTSAPCGASAFVSNQFALTGFPRMAITDRIVSGDITPQSSTALSPEPSSLLLLGTGLTGLCGLYRRRLRRL